MKCPICNDQGMIPSDEPDGDVMNTPCPRCNEADLLCVLRQIEDVKRELDSLCDKMDKLQRMESANKRRKLRAWEKSRNMTVLKMALKGKSHAEIAGYLGIKSHDMTHHIAKAWKAEFPKHYAASEQRIKGMGRMTALKHSPPIFG